MQDMCSCLTVNLQETDTAHWAIVIESELSKLNVDAAFLQRIKLADSRTIMKANYTFL